MALSKSQRVKAIANLAALMKGLDWTNIDLTLKEFGLPVRDNWGSDKYSYCVEMVSTGEDSDLVDLSAHYGIPVEGVDAGAASEPDPPYWSDGRLRVFISHLSAHKEQATHLRSALSRFGMTAFVAHEDVHPTKEWQIEIERALATCDLLIGLLHPEFKESSWCDQEIGYALGRGVPVFMVKQGLDPYGFVSRFQAFNGGGKRATEIAQMIFEASIVHKKLQGRMADIIIDLFVKSNSYADAKTRASYLDKITDWKPDFSERVKRALKENDQIEYSWGASEIAERVLAKHK